MLEWRRLTSACEGALLRFFAVLCDSDRAAFHPHPFTGEAATEICTHSGRDVYGALIDRDEILAYGMLRGWDAGYEVPSLGIVVHPSVRGTGVGKLVMTILHATARRRGAKRVRLTVYPGNRSAVNLYRSMGYQFTEASSDKMVGHLALDPACESP